MLKILDAFPSNVLALEASGEVTADDYRQVLVPAVEERLANHRRLRLLYLLGAGFEGFTGGAAWEDARLGLRHFSAFERVAVVSDTDWVRRMVRGFGFALPGEVRVYRTNEQSAARNWIIAPNDPGELAFQLDEDRGLLVLEPRDELEAGDFERLAAVVDPWLAAGNTLSGIAVVAEEFPGWDDFAAFSGHLGFVKAHHRTVRRVALVSDSRFMAALPRLAGLFVQAELRRFPMEEREQALAWASESLNGR